MDAVIYDSATIYIESVTELDARIAKIKQVIAGLETMAISAATTGNFSEYSLDDGQTKIRTVYRNMTEVLGAIQAFDNLLQMLLQRQNNNVHGRVHRFVDGKNFI